MEDSTLFKRKLEHLGEYTYLGVSPQSEFEWRKNDDK